MMWMETGSPWLDRHVKNLMNFNSELSSCAAMASPLTAEEIDALHRRIKSINTVLCKVAKRQAKKIKK